MRRWDWHSRKAKFNRTTSTIHDLWDMGIWVLKSSIHERVCVENWLGLCSDLLFGWILWGNWNQSSLRRFHYPSYWRVWGSYSLWKGTICWKSTSYSMESRFLWAGERKIKKPMLTMLQCYNSIIKRVW